MYRKKQKSGLYIQQAGNTLARKAINLYCKQIDKKHLLVKWTARYVIFIGAAIKIAVLVIWRTNPVSLC